MSVSSEQVDKKNLLQKEYKVAEDVLFRQVENEGILLHVSSGTYYSLSETSIMFWQALSDAKSLMPVVELITNEYEVKRDRVLEDLQSFLQDLSARGIITPVAE